MLVIVPMSGTGTRFKEAGYTDPKPLININGKYMIEYVVEQFSKEEDTFIFICNKSHIKTTNMKNILDRIVKHKYIYEIDEHKLGPVYAIQQVIHDIKRLNLKYKLDNDGVIVSYCDYGSVWDYNIFKEYIHTNNMDGCILIYTGFHPSLLGKDEYGYIKVNKDNNVVEIQEKKPYMENRFDEKTSNGCYYFRRLSLLENAIDELIDKEIMCKGEYFVSLLYNLLISEGYKIGYYTIDKMLQFGTPDDLEKFIRWDSLFKKLNDNLRTTNSYGRLSNLLSNSSNNISEEHNNTILIQAMAGLGSRFNKYNLPKPLLYINNEHMFVNIVKQLPYCKKKYFICQQEHEMRFNISRIVNNNFNNTENNIVKTLNYLTEGQSSTVYTLKDEIDPNNSILITACDAGLIYNKLEYRKLINDKNVDVIVFASNKEEGTANNPTAYAWIVEDELSNISKIYCKEYPFSDTPNNHKAITGTFFFRKSSYFFENHERLVRKNIRVNNEFYIDQVINECIESGLRVKSFVIEHYLNYGTPNDYMTYHYWNEYNVWRNKNKK